MSKERVYNKLVRDRIPEIITSKGETPCVRVLSDEEYRIELERKLKEEYLEVLAASGRDRIEELADILEIIKCLAELEKSSLDEVIEVAGQKNLKRGSFKDKIFLEKVIE